MRRRIVRCHETSGWLTISRSARSVTFTSSSTVRFFVRAAGARLSDRTRVVSIGPVTSATLREHGLEPDVEASRHDIEGVVEAITADAVHRQRSVAGR